MAIIETRNLTKKYGDLTAVRDLSISVEEGAIYGFVGPNGAGKTTTMHILTTLLAPTAGEAFVAGHSVTRDPRSVRRVIGYMPDYFGVYDDMKVWEYLDFFAACYDIPQNDRLPLIRDLLELVDLSHRAEDMVDDLSRGMKQRLCLARTLAHDPQVLILDEPASGLDPRARIEIRELLVQLAQMGKTIFFSTHILADVREICTQVGIIEAGELIMEGAVEEMQKQLIPTREIVITLLGDLDRAQAFLLGRDGIRDMAEVKGENSHPRLQVSFTGDDAGVSALLAAMIGAGLPILHFNEEQRDLESVFMRATKGIVS